MDFPWQTQVLVDSLDVSSALQNGEVVENEHF